MSSASTPGSDSFGWADVAAPGTSPRRLRRAVEGDRLALVGSDGASPIVASWALRGVQAATRGCPGWPIRLDRLGAGAVAWVAWRGAAVEPHVPAVAIVGARNATSYGRDVASWLAEGLAAAGVVVVSGGAIGIDAAAHEATVASGGRTVVVLGCGHDVDYPRPHAQPGALFDRVLASGGTLLSAELPGAQPRPHRVRARNRLVAALVDAVVVVEGAARSGTLVTAGFAAELGVGVLAVPGDVRAPLSAAPHQLLHEGAAPCREPQDVLDCLGVAMQSSVVAAPIDGVAPNPSSHLPPRLMAALVAAWPRAVSLDELAAGEQAPVAGLLGALTRARIAGEVAMDGVGVRLRRAPT